MSPSESRSLCSFEIVVTPPSGADPEDVQVMVYDGWDKPVFQGSGSASLSLLLGLYTVRWQYSNQMGEQIVRLSSPTERLQLSIQRQTPAPVPGAVDTHEYYSALNQTADASSQTGDPIGLPPHDSRLHLLIRARNRESYHGENLAAGLRLLDQDLQPLLQLDERSHQDANDGFLLCSLPAKSGFYFIEYRPEIAGRLGQLPRLFPVQLFPNWQTRLFVYQANRPLLESASINIVTLSYDQANIYQREESLRVSAAADAALNALQNNQDELPREIERALLMGKFENPLLGLLGTHFLLRHSAPDQPAFDRIQSRRNVSSLQDIFANLQWLLPGSPDVAALLFRAAQLFPNDDGFRRPAPVRYPPLLRASLEMLLDADSESVIAIADDGPLAQLAPSLYYDSPWATFRPPVSQIESLDAVTKGGMEFESFNLPSYAESNSRESDAWLEGSVTDILQSTARTGRDPDWSLLAAGLGVSYRKMMGAVQMVKGRQGPDSHLGAAPGISPEEPPKLPTT